MLQKSKLSAVRWVAAVFMVLLSGSNASCEDWWTEAGDPKNFSATVTFATDYVFRGVSQTDNKPAVQGSFDYKHPSGAYLGIWGSNVDDSISKGEHRAGFLRRVRLRGGQQPEPGCLHHLLLLPG